ncbi:MAG TPA: T9SS type A sorting domain-containing protein [Parafilimonas sp.]|nr:T9SS type A sorting domain-containing protein [Parafilimonas sp.]
MYIRSVLPIICLCLFSQQLRSQKVDTILTEGSIQYNYVNFEKQINSYNQSCNIVTSLRLSWNFTLSKWMNFIITTYNYNGENVSTKLDQHWDTVLNAWQNDSVATFNYNTSSQLTSTVRQIWNINAWRNLRRETNTYDAYGRLATMVVELWDTLANGWENFESDSLKYNADGLLSREFGYSWDTVASAWVTSGRATLTYDADKNLTETLSENWHNGWTNAERYSYTYTTAGKRQTILDQWWYIVGNSGYWQNRWTSYYTYDLNNYLIYYLFQEWSFTFNRWNNVTQLFYSNKPDGKIFQVFDQTWYVDEWLDEARYTYSYTTDCTLPLTLLDLTATNNNNSVKLNWRTVNEINTAYFTVQRSTNGRTFADIGRVTAIGNSSKLNNYTYLDNTSQLNTNKVYYRLAMVDQDGKSTLSKVVSLEVHGNDFLITPNPAKHYFIIKSSAGGGFRKATLLIADNGGRIVMKKDLNGFDEEKIDVSALARGVYLVYILDADGVRTQKLVVE